MLALLLRLASAIVVDRYDPSAADIAGCGLVAAPPCLSIRWAAAQGGNLTVHGPAAGGSSATAAASASASAAAPYRGECSGRGIRLGSGGTSSFALVGVGGPVVACEGRGRAFTFSGDADDDDDDGDNHSNGTLLLQGLTIRGGVAPRQHGRPQLGIDGSGGAVWVSGAAALLLRHCVFENCTAGDPNDGTPSGGGGAGDGGAVFVRATRVVDVSASTFVGTRTTGGTSARGGAVCVAGMPLAGARLNFSGSAFVDTASVGSGGAIDALFGDGTTDAGVAIDGCNFTGTGAAKNGGAVGVSFAGAATDATVRVSRALFVRTRSGAWGGGVAVLFGFDSAVPLVALRSGATFEGCRFVNTSATSKGGGLVVYFGTSTEAFAVADGCAFEGTVASGSSEAEGGGIALWHQGTSVSPRTALRRCVFVRARTTGAGGGVHLLYGGSIFGSSSFLLDASVAGCNFTECEATGTPGGVSGGGGFAAKTINVARDAVFSVSGCSFVGNRASEADGGAAVLHMTTPASGALVSFVRNHFEGNSVGPKCYGGALALLLPNELPENLVFVGNTSAPGVLSETSPCGSCNADCAIADAKGLGCPSFSSGFPFYPVTPALYRFRQWKQTNIALLTDNVFRGNTAGLTGGGVLGRGGGHLKVERCLLEGNDAATLFGGGLALQGTMGLTVVDSTLANNTCEHGGCQLYSASAGGLTFAGNTSIELACATGGSSADGVAFCHEGVKSVTSGSVAWAGASRMSCAPGFTLRNGSTLQCVRSLLTSAFSFFYLLTHSLTHSSSTCFPLHFSTCCLPTTRYETTLPEQWKLQAGPTRASSNCPCYFSAVGPPTFGKGADAVVTPVVRVSTLSYFCVGCAAGRFGAVPSVLSAQSPSASAPTDCTPCPAGTYQPRTSQPGCLVCPAGSLCREGTSVPTQCPVGSFCPAGSAVSTPCNASVCPAGAAAPQQCPAGDKCSRGEATPCPAGRFAARDSSVCLPCPEQGVVCANGLLQILPGWWVPDSARENGVVSSTVLVSCGRRCLPPNQANESVACAEGYTGAACLACEPGYAATGSGTCRVCTGAGTSAALAATLALLLLSFFTYFVHSAMVKSEDMELEQRVGARAAGTAADEITALDVASIATDFMIYTSVRLFDYSLLLVEFY